MECYDCKLLVRKDPEVGFISEGVLEALVEGHVVLGGSAVGLDPSCLPGLTILGEDVGDNIALVSITRLLVNGGTINRNDMKQRMDYLVGSR
mmetsp:Transcript_25957/g.54691  ORF Transcript_25957/g.54691 Transcript_25957/m.54691 type:complete len:92 (+) Transcript_25957:879-1154(+)